MRAATAYHLSEKPAFRADSEDPASSLLKGITARPAPQLTTIRACTHAANMTPFELVKSRYDLPCQPYPFQETIINDRSLEPKTGLYMDTGTGKTLTSTYIALFKVLQGADIAICIMPPILIPGWMRWLRKIDGITCQDYRGSPKHRMTIPFASTFMLMSMQVFKNDYDHIVKLTKGRALKVITLVDEATSIKNVGSGNHQHVREFAEDTELILLTGTPVSQPGDVYAYTKLIAPTLYRNLRQFENIHVAERDFFDKPVKWQNLQLLNENLMVNAVRVFKRDVLKNLPDILYDPVYYELEPKHYKLYKKLADEQLLELEQSGGKIDATTGPALYHALQQIIVNWGHFADDPTCVSSTVEYIEELLEELGDKKLIVFSKYRMTNRLLVERLKPYGAVGAFGDLSTTQQRRNIDRFIDDPKCRVLDGQPTSVGFGVDGMQDVCNDAFFPEIPEVPFHFHQACDRLWRDGQKHKVHIRIGVAEKTCQVRMFKNLLDKDHVIGRVQGTMKDLRSAIFGE